MYSPSSVIRMSASPSPVTSMNLMFGSDQSSTGSAANRCMGSKSASSVRSKKPGSGPARSTTSRRPLPDRSSSRTPARSAAGRQGSDGLQRPEARPGRQGPVRLRYQVAGTEIPLVVPAVSGIAEDPGQALAVQVGPAEGGAVEPFRQVGLARRIQGEHVRLYLRLAVAELQRRHGPGDQALVALPVAGLRHRDHEGVDRAAGVGRRLLVGVGQVHRPDEAVRAGRRLGREVVEQQQPLDSPVGPDLEAGAVGRERVGAQRPGLVRLRRRRHAGVVAVVEYHAEHPVGRQRGLPLGRPVGQVGLDVPVLHGLEVDLGRAGLRCPVRLVRRGLVDPGAILGGVAVDGGVALVIPGPADLPGKYPGRIGRVGDRAPRVGAVQRR